MSDCVKRLVEKSNGVFDAAEAKKLLKDVENIARKKSAKGFDYDDAVKDTLTEYAVNVKANLEKQKLNTLRNIAKNKSLEKRIDDLVNQGLTVQQAFRAEIEGTEKLVAGGRYSADLQAEAVTAAHLGAFTNALEKEDLLSVLNSKALNKEIVNELRLLEDGQGVKSGSAEARRIAEIIHQNKETLRVRLNRAGADIGEIDGHTMMQTHDPYKMRQIGEDAWVAQTRPLLDEKLTFEGVEDLDRALRQAYQAMVTGVRLDNPLEVKDAKLFQFTGPSNLGKKVSRSRKIFFKDANSWLAYNEKFGKYDFNDSVISMFSRSADDVALMERYGTNPEANIKAVLDKSAKKYRGKIATTEKLNKDSVYNMVDELMGKNAEPSNPRLARWSSNYRQYQSVLRLGGAVISSVTDIPTKSLMYQYQGKSVLDSYVQPFLDIAQGFKSKKERVEFASLLGTGMEGMIGDIAGRFSSGDTASSKAMKISRLYFKLNGLAWWTDTHKLAMGKVLSNDLGNKKGISFAALDEDTARNFKRFGITEADWEVMRNATREMPDGRRYIFAEDIKKQTTADKLSAYYIDIVNSGVISPDQKSRRIGTFGTRRGTPVGEAARLMMQFKQFPITQITRTWGRILWGKGKLDVPAAAQLAIMSGVFGYIAMSAKDITKGKEPKKLSNPETIVAAYAQGGGFSIAGDLAFGTRSLSATIGGPALGQAEEVYNIYKATKGAGDAKAKAAKFVMDSTVPNLFYVRPALDNLILYQVQEQLNAGYLRRMEQRMKKDYDQEYWLRPKN